MFSLVSPTPFPQGFGVELDTRHERPVLWLDGRAGTALSVGSASWTHVDGVPVGSQPLIAVVLFLLEKFLKDFLFVLKGVHKGVQAQITLDADKGVDWGLLLRGFGNERQGRWGFRGSSGQKRRSAIVEDNMSLAARDGVDVIDTLPFVVVVVVVVVVVRLVDFGGVVDDDDVVLVLVRVRVVRLLLVFVMKVLVRHER